MIYIIFTIILMLQANSVTSSAFQDFATKVIPITYADLTNKNHVQIDVDQDDSITSVNLDSPINTTITSDHVITPISTSTQKKFNTQNLSENYNNRIYNRHQAQIRACVQALRLSTIVEAEKTFVMPNDQLFTHDMLEIFEECVLKEVENLKLNIKPIQYISNTDKRVVLKKNYVMYSDNAQDLPNIFKSKKIKSIK